MNTSEILFKKAESYGYRSWFPTDIFSLPSYSLKNEQMFMAFNEAMNEAKNIDCIWFDGELRVPALFKVCSENIVEGLCRLNNVKGSMPPFFIKYYLVVDDDDYRTAEVELKKPTFNQSGILILKKSELLDANLN